MNLHDREQGDNSICEHNLRREGNYNSTCGHNLRGGDNFGRTSREVIFSQE